MQIVLRGATNVWFADTRSSIYIPTDDDQTNKIILAILDKSYETVSASRVNGEWNRPFIDMLADMNHVDRDKLYEAFLRREAGLEGFQDVNEEMSEDVLHKSLSPRSFFFSYRRAALPFNAFLLFAQYAVQPLRQH